MTPDDWRRLADLVDESAGSPDVLSRLLRLEATKDVATVANDNPDLPKRGPKPYPVKFETLWRALGHLGGIGNSLKSEAYAAWLQVGQPMDNVATRWGEYIASLPAYQTTPRHVGRWLKALGHEQVYQPYQAPKTQQSANGAARGMPSTATRDAFASILAKETIG